MHALDEVDLLLILALVARAVATAVDANEQWRWAVALLQPKIELVPRMHAVGDVRLRGLRLRSIGLALAPEFLKSPCLGQRENAVLVGIGSGGMLEDFLQISVGLGGRLGRTTEHGRKQ